MMVMPLHEPCATGYVCFGAIRPDCPQLPVPFAVPSQKEAEDGEDPLGNVTHIADPQLGFRCARDMRETTDTQSQPKS